jgi:hypothetical protein
LTTSNRSQPESPTTSGPLDDVVKPLPDSGLKIQLPEPLPDLNTVGAQRVNIPDIVDWSNIHFYYSFLFKYIFLKNRFSDYFPALLIKVPKNNHRSF